VEGGCDERMEREVGGRERVRGGMGAGGGGGVEVGGTLGGGEKGWRELIGAGERGGGAKGSVLVLEIKKEKEG